MLNIKKPNTRNTYRVKVVDCDGNEETFACARDVSKLMGVTVQAIYTAISRQITICGCRVYKIEEEQ